MLFPNCCYRFPFTTKNSQLEEQVQIGTPGFFDRHMQGQSTATLVDTLVRVLTS